MSAIPEDLREAIATFQDRASGMEAAWKAVLRIAKQYGMPSAKLSAMLKPRRTGVGAVEKRIGGNSRISGSTRSRFVGTAHHADRESAALPASHPAILDGRSLFSKSVVDPTQSPRVLVSGHNNAKLGRTIEKGAWKGLPIYQLTLEERATCPTTCTTWRECYGNSMHLARRHKHGPELLEALSRELSDLAVKHGGAFAVRLHVLGDFYSVDYVHVWRDHLRNRPGLHIWGYTARNVNDPIGAAIASLNRRFPDRCVIRFSVPSTASPAPMEAAAIWRQPEGPVVPEGRVCPQQFDQTATCGTCGMCWAEAHRDERIVFVGHGMNRGRRRPPDTRNAGGSPR